MLSWVFYTSWVVYIALLFYLRAGVSSGSKNSDKIDVFNVEGNECHRVPTLEELT